MADGNDWSEEPPAPRLESFSPDELTGVDDGFYVPDADEDEPSGPLPLILFVTAVITTVAVGVILIAERQVVPDVDVSLAEPTVPDITPEQVGQLGLYAEIGMPMSKLEPRTTPTDTPGTHRGRPVFARLNWDCLFVASKNTDKPRLVRFTCDSQPLTGQGFRSWSSVISFASSKYGAPTTSAPGKGIWSANDVVMMLEKRGEVVVLDVRYELE